MLLIKFLSKKLFFLIFIILAIIILSYKYFSKIDTNIKNRKNVTVETIMISKKKIFDQIEVLGRIYANESVEIRPNVSEIVKEINFEGGEKVKKGQILVILNYDEEKSMLRSAKIEQKENEREFNRAKKLIKNDAINKQDYDKIETRLELSKEKIKLIESYIDDRIIRAPFDGVISIRNISPGTLVTTSNIIASLNDISSVKLDFTVHQTHVDNLKIDNPIIARYPSDQNKIFKGKVDFIDSVIDSDTNSISARSILKNENRLLKSGTSMVVMLPFNKRNAIVIPEESVIQKKDKYFVYKIDDKNEVHKVEIKTLMHRDGIVEVVEGLNARDNIVIRGIHKIIPGQIVNQKRI